MFEGMAGCGSLFCFCGVLALAINLLEGSMQEARQCVVLLCLGVPVTLVGIYGIKRGW